MHSLSEVNSIAEAITQRQRLVITSHARPDGDSIGSELALAHALKSLQKDVRVINRDPVPSYLASFPGTSDIEICHTIEHTFDAAIVLECPSLERTGVTGLDRSFVINIDHHLGNMVYGDLNWFDETAAACGEMVFDLVTTLGVRLTPSITTHLYVAILTDTGSFRHSNITAKTFRICETLAQAGIAPPAIADRVFQNGTVGKLRTSILKSAHGITTPVSRQSASLKSAKASLDCCATPVLNWRLATAVADSTVICFRYMIPVSKMPKKRIRKGVKTSENSTAGLPPSDAAKLRIPLPKT